MARPLRIEIEDGLYHVMSRGLERRSIARDDTDHTRWLNLLGQVCVRREWRVHAFALMPNHFHLFLKTPHADLSAGMHDLNSAYVTGFNRRHARSGPLFQGRFKAILVDHEEYGWALSRYIDLNPVRARLVDDPAAYAWASHRWFAGARGCPEWLTRDEVLAEHGRTLRTARKAYREFVLAAVDSPPPSPLRNAVGGVLGAKGFVDEVRRRLEGLLPDRNVPDARALRRTLTPADVAAATADVFGVSVDSLRERGRRGNTARDAAVVMTRRLTGLPLRAIGAWFGDLSEPSVSNICRGASASGQQRAKLRKIEAHLTDPSEPTIGTN